MDSLTLIRIVAILITAICACLFYFLPSFIARRRCNSKAIFLVNLLTGWTAFGWIAALIWALKSETLPVVIVHQRLAPQTFCSHCGKCSFPDAQFCQTCGQSLLCSTAAGVAR